MSHYPSSAELAAFRRSIARRFYTVDPLAHPPYATDQELRDGIGYRETQTLDRMWSWTREHHADESDAERRSGGAVVTILDARREASALRSRAYWAADCPNGWGLFASYAERVGGIPYWDDPIVSTDTWTEDEPRSPLPIRYQPSFVIVR